MGFFSFTQEIAMDLGTANTIITSDGKIVVDEPSVVDDAVYDGGHLVVAECRSPPAELQVRGDHRRLPLVGVGEDLEEGPRAVPRRAAGHDVGPFEVVNQ